MWSQVRKLFGFQAGSLCALIVANHQFPTSLRNDFFLLGLEKDIVSFKDLYMADVFHSFNQLRAKSNIPQLQVWDWAITTGYYTG